MTPIQWLIIAIIALLMLGLIWQALSYFNEMMQKAGKMENVTG